MISDQPVRFGYLGTGSILKKFAAAFPLTPGCRLEAIASRDPARAHAAAAQYHVPRTLAGYEALVTDPTLDAVIIALPNGWHCEWTCRALAAGKHVLCEKPLACSSAEVDQMFAAAHRHGRWLMEGFMYRFHPQMAAMFARLPELGRILHVSSKRMAGGREPGNPRFDPAAGGGALLDIGCYSVDFARAVFGSEPLRATAVAHRGPTGVDLTMTATLEFAGNATAQFCCSMESEPSFEAEIIGTTGRILVPHPWNPPVWPTEFQVFHGLKPETVRVAPVGIKPHPLIPFIGEIEHFADCIRANRPPSVVTEADSRGTMRALEMVRTAAGY